MKTLPLLYADSLSGLPWLRHGFTTRAGGTSQVYGRPDDLNLGLTQEDDPAAVQANRGIALAALASNPAGPPWSLVHTRQIHSAIVLALPKEAPYPTTPADGLVTMVPGSLLGVLAADCVPILLADRRRRVVAAVHAGWRGTVARIAQVAVQTMQGRFGSRLEDLAAAIGPSIGPCCYQVGQEVHTRFHEAFPYAHQLFAASHLDLWQANHRQLQEAGLESRNLSVLAACTVCSSTPRFFSHRADMGRTGRMMGLIGIVPDSTAREAIR